MPKPRLTLRDWLFGAGGKRRVLEALIRDGQRVWTQSELARSAELGPKGSIDEHLLVLVQLRVLAEADGRYRLESEHALVPPLRDILTVLADVPTDELDRP